MAVINTLVAKSKDVNAAALNLNAKAFEIRRTLAGIWDLKPCGTEVPKDTIHLDMKNPTDESVIGEGDERVKVDEKHFMPGGKYRCLYLPSCLAHQFTNQLLSNCEALHSL